MDNRDITEKKQLPEIYEYEESIEVLIVNSKSDNKVRGSSGVIIPIAVHKKESNVQVLPIPCI